MDSIRIEKMTPSEKIKKVKEWQACDYTHELTCANDSSHKLLEALPNPETELGVYLRCPTCGYVQIYIPDIVLESDVSKIIERHEKVFGQKQK